jgi:hypothetical protein
MNPETNHEEMNAVKNEGKERLEAKPVNYRDARGRLNWLNKEQEEEDAPGFKASNNARLNLEFYRNNLERSLVRRVPGPENRNGLHLLKMLEGIAEDFANLELTDAQRKLMRQVVDELERRTLDDRNEEDSRLREDMNARVMQLYTFLKTIENSQQ